MKLRRNYFAMFTLPAIASSVIYASSVSDVSSQTSVAVRTGDSLVFQVQTWNFAWNAAALGLSVSPADVSFALISSAAGVNAGVNATVNASLQVTLESQDRQLALPFGNLVFTAGHFQGSSYAGEVATLQGYLHLTPLLSEALFAAPSAVIVLRNQGPDLTLGLVPYALRYSMFTTLSGGGLSVGAIPGQVDLENSDKFSGFGSFGRIASLQALPEVPEPHSGGLFLAGAILLCGISAGLARFSRSSA